MEISVFYTLCLRVLRILGETAECERAECGLQTEFTITRSAPPSKSTGVHSGKEFPINLFVLGLTLLCYRALPRGRTGRPPARPGA
eukprot:4667051-Prymnesium_polylepis.1